MQNVLEILKARGLFEAATSAEAFEFVTRPATVYAGFDPTSTSLQVGNLIVVMGLAHFQRCGHRVVAVVGGATGLIGDPSGRTAERGLLAPETVQKNLEGIRENLARFLDFEGGRALIVNNHDWLGRFTLLDFLRDVGKHFRMGVLLGKESVRARLDSEAGMSFAEFSYPLLQAYDFLHLYDTQGCRLQIGGADQWGNITAGCDLIRKLRGVEAYGVTLPLVCDSRGQKFGKSEGNAVYLDAARTSYYDFYQFFVRTDDADVIRFLKLFTFVPLEEIAELEQEMRKAPEARLPQKRLAEELTRAVHGAHGLQVAQRASAVLFGGSLAGLRADDLLEIFAHVPSAELPAARVRGAPVVEVVTAAGLCRSKGEARRLIAEGGLYLNDVRITDPAARVDPDRLVEGRLAVFRAGKKTFHLVKLV